MRGGYLLFLELKKPRVLAVGRLGRRRFPAGLYVYAGSGLKGVESRVKRHFSEKKTKRWHIDHLTAVAKTLDFIAFESERRIECDLAASMQRLGGRHLVKGFGSSDCRCESHLIFLGGLKVAKIQNDRAWSA